MNGIQAVLNWGDLAATLILVGGLVYAALLTVPSPRGQRWLVGAATVLAPVLVLELVVTAFRLHAVTGLGALRVVPELIQARWGRLWVARAMGLGVLAAAARAATLDARWKAALGAVWLLAKSFQGHAGAHGTVPALVDWLHLAAASVWLGGLGQLMAATEPLPMLLALRFRRVATLALAALTPAGLYGAFLHVPTLHALATSPYGRTLIGKLALAVVLLGLAAANHFRYVPAFARGDAMGSSGLRRVVAAELALGLLVLLASALLGVLPMPHELAGASG